MLRFPHKQGSCLTRIDGVYPQNHQFEFSTNQGSCAISRDSNSGTSWKKKWDLWIFEKTWNRTTKQKLPDHISYIIPLFRRRVRRTETTFWTAAYFFGLVSRPKGLDSCEIGDKMWEEIIHIPPKKKSGTVDGWNSAPVEVGSLFHYLQGFINIPGGAGFPPWTVPHGSDRYYKLEDWLLGFGVPGYHPEWIAKSWSYFKYSSWEKGGS